MSMNLDFSSPIVIGGIILTIVIIGLLIFKFFIEDFTSLSNSDIDIDKITNALRYTGVKNIDETNNNSEQNIVFNSTEKINIFFELFMETYFPILDINFINNLLIENNSSNTQNIINNKKINAFELLFGNIDKSNLVKLIYALIYSLNNKTYLVLLGLFMLILIQNKSSNIDFYYYNDYKDINDFVIYIVPKDYTGNLSNLNKDNTIIEINFDMDINNTVPSKIYLIKGLRNHLLRQEALKFKNSEQNNLLTTMSINNITDATINEYLESIKENTTYLITYIRYSIASIFLFLDKEKLLSTDKIIIDNAELINTSDNFTNNFRNYANLKIDTIENVKQRLIEEATKQT